MAEFVEVLKQRKRMCDNCKDRGSFCDACRANLQLISEDSKDFEDFVMTWAYKHPVKTNADKFKEVFGFFPATKFCPYTIENCGEQCDESYCNHYNFWEQEYKEPKGNK